MRARNLAALAAFLLGLGCQSAPEGTVAFVNVSVLPMDNERVLEAQTVVTWDRPPKSRCRAGPRSWTGAANT